MIPDGWISNIGGEMSDVIECQVICDVTSNCNLGTHIDENANGAVEKIWMLPDGIVDLFPEAVLGGFHFRQLEHGKQNRKQDQENSKEINVQFDNRILRSTLSGSAYGFAENQPRTNEREHGCAKRIECLCQIEAAGGSFRSAEHGN